MEYELSVEDLQRIAALHERRASIRRENALSADRRTLQNALVEDIGRILSSKEMTIAPMHESEWRRIIEGRMQNDVRFRAELQAFLNLCELWLDSERERCIKAIKDEMLIDNTGTDENDAYDRACMDCLYAIKGNR